MFFDTLSRRSTCVQLHYTHLIPFRYLLAQTLNTISFGYSTFGWFANNICILYATGRLSSPIQYFKESIPNFDFRTHKKKQKKSRLQLKGWKINHWTKINPPADGASSSIVPGRYRLRRAWFLNAQWFIFLALFSWGHLTACQPEYHLFYIL